MLAPGGELRPGVKRHPPLRIRATPSFTHPGPGFQGLLIFDSPSTCSGPERLLQVPKPVAAALDVDDVRLVQQPVENGRGQGLVAGQWVVYDLLFDCAGTTLKDFGLNPDQLGAELGMTAVLHTHARDKTFHL